MVSVGPDALIFDLDGTLWDAAAASTYGWNLALEEMGLSQRVSDAGIRSVSGKPFPECVSTLLPELAPWPADLQEHIEVRERTGIELIAGDLYPGVGEGLRRLAARYPLFLVSNCPGWYLEEFFRHSGLRELFSGWDCWGLSGIPKSGMLSNLAATRHLERAVYVGDTKGDRAATESAGLEFAFVEYGFGEIEGARLSFATFDGLAAHFLGAAAPEQLQAIQDTYDDASSWCYGCGRLNDLGLHLRTFVEGEETITRCVPDPRYTGGRDFLYGGLIASIIDCHSTATAAAAGYAVEGRAIGSEPRLRYVTASLKVDYVAPSPVGEPLEVRGKATEVKGRKVVVESELRVRGQLCARGHVVAVLYR